MSELSLSTSLWLEVSLGERTWLFEFEAGADRAVVVGSDSNADVLVVRPGVGSTHFHFERDGAAIVLVPGYRAALRVNSVRTLEPVALPKHATIELLNLSLGVKTHENRPTHVRATEPPPAPSMFAPREYFQNLPSEADTTGFTLPPASGAATRFDFDTVEVPRPVFDMALLPRVAFEADGTLPLEPPKAPVPPTAPVGPTLLPLGPRGTVMLAVPQLDEDAPKVSTRRLPVPRLAASLPVSDAASSVAQATARSERQRANQTTRIEVPLPHRFKASRPIQELPVPQAPTSSAAPQVSLAAQRTVDFDVAAVPYFLLTPPSGSLPGSPNAQNARQSPTDGATSGPEHQPPVAPVIPATPRSGAKSYLALLGYEAMRRPTRVAAIATGIAAVAALALVGASRFTTRPVASPPAVSGTANPPLPPARPSASANPAQAALPAPPPGGRAPAVQDVAAAVNHLLAGRRQEAGSAYRQLSAAEPSNPAYAAIARMLAQRTSPRCSATPTPSGCPEVLP